MGFQDGWTKAEIRVLSKLTTPNRIQSFLDQLAYSAEERYRCPRSVLRDRKAHCYDGAVFAAAALQRLGHPPKLVNMLAERDDEHLLAVFKQDGCWGAIAKSNFAGMRFREPIYRTLRELIMSYFEHYYNLERLKSLRSYTRPLDLRAFDKLHWLVDDAGMDAIADSLDRLHPIPVCSAKALSRLSPVDERAFQAGLLGANMAGICDPDA